MSNEDQAIGSAVSSSESQVSVAEPASSAVSSNDGANVPRGTSTQSEAPAAQEKMLPQSKVNELVGKTRVEERAKAMREAEARYANQATQQQAAPQQQNIGGMPQLDEQRIRQLYHEEAQKQIAEKVNYQVASDFMSKIEGAKEKYPDMDEVINELELNSWRMNEIGVFNEFDNAADIIHELGTNPGKLSLIVPLVNRPNLMRKELRKLSESIKANEKAIQQPKANPPLSQISPSTTTVDNGKQTVSDLRRQPWLRA